MQSMARTTCCAQSANGPKSEEQSSQDDGRRQQLTTFPPFLHLWLPIIRLMDNGFVRFNILKDRLKHGDIVTLYNWNPEWPALKCLVRKESPDDEIKCIYLSLPSADLSTRHKWESIVRRSTQPVTRIGSHYQYNSFGNSYHLNHESLFATVTQAPLSEVIGHGMGKIHNQDERAAQLRKSGYDFIRIPSPEQVKQYMDEVVSSIGTEVVFDPIFANCEHWVTMKRFNGGWSSQVEDMVTQIGVWNFVMEAASGGTAGVSHFFRTFGDYRHTPLGNRTVTLVDSVLPAVSPFITEITCMRPGFLLTRAGFRAIVASGAAFGVILSVLMWYWMSLKDIVSRPKATIVTSEMELRKAYEGIDHFAVVCNMGSVAWGVIPSVWNKFVSWLLTLAEKIILTIESMTERRSITQQ